MKKKLHIFGLFILSLLLTSCATPNQYSENSSTGMINSVTDSELQYNIDNILDESPPASLPDIEDSDKEQLDNIPYNNGQYNEQLFLPEDGTYTSKDDVSLYLYLYGHLPPNFITKKEARKLGWEGGSLEPFAPGMCIGGDYFGNYEQILPEEEGRTYNECDIDTLGADKRGSKRIVFSNDGLIYYTEDHYNSFELLYERE